jgi:hypothetical protein
VAAETRHQRLDQLVVALEVRQGHELVAVALAHRRGDPVDVVGQGWLDDHATTSSGRLLVLLFA